MKIYISHSTAFDYKEELYKVIRQTDWSEEVEFVLPHELSSDQSDIKSLFQEIDLIIAEVSCPSTGQGIELGFAETINVPMVCIYQKGMQFSAALNTICDKFYEYDSDSERSLIDVIKSL